MRQRFVVLGTALLAGCAATPIPPAETEFYREQLDLARAALSADAGPEGRVIRESAAKLEARALQEAESARRGDDTAGLIDLDAPGAREFVAKVSDPAQVEAALGSAPLGVEQVLLAVHARNPDVAAARREWASRVRMYEQATYLEDLLLRYAAFTRLATPRVGGAPMREAAFPYPGLVALKGEMIDREVAMAREMARMRLRDAAVAAVKAWHGVAFGVEELRIRDEQVGLAERAVAAARARVASGTTSQADLLEMETELAMARNERTQAERSLTRSKADLNTLLDRAPDAPVAVTAHGDPPATTPDREALLELARRYAPEIRVADASIGLTAAAIRMAESMLFAAPAPGAVATGAPMGGTSMPAEAMPEAGSSMSGAMGAPMGEGGASKPAAQTPPLPPRDAPPTGAPGAFGADVAWVAEMRERHASLLRAKEEAVRATERRVIEAHYELDAMRRMFEVAAKTAEPLSAQAVEERMRLYEAGRAMFDDLLGAIRRRLAASHDAVKARHDYGEAETMLWMAIGARPEIVGTKENGR